MIVRKWTCLQSDSMCGLEVAGRGEKYTLVSHVRGICTSDALTRYEDIKMEEV
jgi:hypothetical protein